MSGDGGGILIGGALLVAAMPIVLGGAVVVGCTYGLIKLASAGVKAAERHHHETELKVERCSAELAAVYGELETAMKNERAASKEYFESVETKLKATSTEIEKAASRAPDTAAIRLEAKRAQEAGSAALGAERKKELERIQKETKAECERITAALAESQKTMMKLKSWTSAKATETAEQMTVAKELLRDAKASVDLLERIAKNDPFNAGFTGQVNAMIEAYNQASAAFNDGVYQRAASTAQTIITRSASLAIEHEEEIVVRDQMLAAAEARLEGLREQLKTMRSVTFEDETYGEVEEELDAYTQGEFGKLEQEVCELLDKVRASAEHAAPSRAELQELEAYLENKLTPRANELVEQGHKRLIQYYERLHAFEVITEHLKQNGYEAEFGALPQNDRTQKMVVKFVEPVNGNSISVTLDEDMTTEDIGRMAMEVMFYYENGRPVTEAEKQEIRKGIENALHEKGLGGTLSCTGSVGKQASDDRFNSEEKVQSIPAEVRVRA